MNFCTTPWITVFSQQSEPHWSAILTGISTPIIALFSLFIAYQQWKTARNKLKFDLYEKRLVIYTVTINSINKIITSDLNSVDTTQIKEEYLIGIRGARWLFDDQMYKYLNDDLWPLILDFENIKLDKNVQQERINLTKRLHEHLNCVEQKFNKFLSLKH